MAFYSILLHLHANVPQVESELVGSLVEFVNSEIVLASIHDVSQVFGVLSTSVFSFIKYISCAL